MSIHYTYALFKSSFPPPLFITHTLELPELSILLAQSSQFPHSQLSPSLCAKARGWDDWELKKNNNKLLPKVVSQVRKGATTIQGPKTGSPTNYHVFLVFLEAKVNLQEATDFIPHHGSELPFWWKRTPDGVYQGRWWEGAAVFIVKI